MWGEEGFSDFQNGKKGTKERNVVRIDERMSLSLSLSFCLSTKRNVSKG